MYLQCLKPDIDITLCKSSKLDENVTNVLKSGTQIKFGTIFTDHMIKIYYDKHSGGWQKPYITPLEHLHLHPAAKVLHYATEVRKITLFLFIIVRTNHYIIILIMIRNALLIM